MDDPARVDEGGAIAAGLATRTLRATTMLLDVHMKFARREAADDFSRVAVAAALAFGAVLFAAVAVAAANVAFVIALHDTRGLSWTVSAAAVASVNAALGVGCLLWARDRLKRPLLRETRDLVEKTVNAFARHD